MATPALRVLLEERGFTETGITLRALCAETGRSLELCIVSKAASLVHILQTYCPDAALLDLSLLQPDPPAAIRVLYQNSSLIPLIVFAGPADRAAAEMCLQTGAKDYMLEGFMDVRTLDRVLHAAICGAQSDSRIAASRDLLTGLANPSGLLGESRPRFLSPPFSGGRLVFSVSLENHETIEAHSGAATTDRILQELAWVLQKSVRSSDIVAHVARGHFVLIVTDTGDSSLSCVRKRITARVEQYQRSSSAGVPLALSLFAKFAPDAALPAFHEFLRTLPNGEARSRRSIGVASE